MLTYFALSRVIIWFIPHNMHMVLLWCVFFAVSHILADVCDFFIHNLLCCFAGSMGYTKYGIFPTFSSEISNKNISIFVSFYVNWYKLANKPSDANSGTYANIDQGFILNLGLNHIQHAVFTSNQSKHMWFAPLIRNMNCTITYTYVHKNYPVYDKYIHGLKTNILEQIIQVSMRLGTVNVPYFYRKIVVKLVFYTFHLRNYVNSSE